MKLDVDVYLSDSFISSLESEKDRKRDSLVNKLIDSSNCICTLFIIHMFWIILFDLYLIYENFNIVLTITSLVVLCIIIVMFYKVHDSMNKLCDSLLSSYFNKEFVSLIGKKKEIQNISNFLRNAKSVRLDSIKDGVVNLSNLDNTYSIPLDYVNLYDLPDCTPHICVTDDSIDIYTNRSREDA